MSIGGSGVEELTGRLDVLMGAEKWAEAERLLLESRDRAAREGRASEELSLCSELMGFYRQRGNAPGFYEARDRAVELLGSLRVDAMARGTILVNAATGMVAFGEAREALPLYREAESCYRRSLGASDFRLAALYNNMAFAWAGAGDPARGEEMIRRAMGVLSGIPHHPDMGTSWVNLALLYAGTDPSDPRIGDCLDRAMVCFDDPETVWDGYYAHTVRKCAGAFTDLGKPEQGSDLLERAELIYEGT